MRLFSLIEQDPRRKMVCILSAVIMGIADLGVGVSGTMQIGFGRDGWTFPPYVFVLHGLALLSLGFGLWRFWTSEGRFWRFVPFLGCCWTVVRCCLYNILSAILLDEERKSTFEVSITVGLICSWLVSTVLIAGAVCFSCFVECLLWGIDACLLWGIDVCLLCGVVAMH